MDIARLRSARLRAHRLTAPAASMVAAAEHLVATQAQEFWGGRWALAARTRGEPTLTDVDTAFDRGELVRAWTMRGTLHIVRARDLRRILAVTAERQRRQFAATRHAYGLGDAELTAAEDVVAGALAGGNRLTRAEFAAVLEAQGVVSGAAPVGHVLVWLVLSGRVVLGPVVPRSGGPSREQYLVAADEWIPAPSAPADAAGADDPAAWLLTGYLRGHGPARLADFAWWTGLPVGAVREAREHAGAAVVDLDDGLLALADAAPRRTATPAVLALPPFDEYYLSYADRTVACPPERVDAVGPSKNGIVRPILLRDGCVVGTWSHSTAAGRYHLPPAAHPFTDLPASDVDAALARFSRFLVPA
jgi:hypothetical protein